MLVTLNVGGVPVVTSLDKQDIPVGTLQTAIAATSAFINAQPPQAVADATDQTTVVDVTLDSGGSST